MNHIYHTLFYILSCVINKTAVSPEQFSGMSSEDWAQLYLLSKVQGVTAVVFEQIQVLPSTSMDKNLFLKWLVHTKSIEKQMSSKLNLSREFIERMYAEGLQLQIMKGQALASYYPNTLQREYGDLDCRAFRIIDGHCEWRKSYEMVNIVAEQIGAHVERDYYKHSHITYKGLTIENHQFFVAVRANKRNTALDRHLRSLVEKAQSDEPLERTMALAEFNALFLTAHAMNHFLFENIRLRHLTDWALFLKAEQNNIDWAKFWSWCDQMRFTEFALCFNYLCTNLFHLDLCEQATFGFTPQIETLSLHMMDDIIHRTTVSKKAASSLHCRLELAFNFFRSSWKFHKFLHTSSLLYLLKMGLGLIFDRNPKG